MGAALWGAVKPFKDSVSNDVSSKDSAPESNKDQDSNNEPAE